MSNDNEPRLDGDIIENKSPKLKRPRLWHVVLLNDDFTPMAFVVALVMRVFHHPQDEAERIMMEVHQKGRGIAGTYTHEVAETKAYECITISRSHEYPLMAIIEPET